MPRGSEDNILSFKANLGATVAENRKNNNMTINVSDKSADATSDEVVSEVRGQTLHSASKDSSILSPKVSHETPPK